MFLYWFWNDTYVGHDERCRGPPKVNIHAFETILCNRTADSYHTILVQDLSIKKAQVTAELIVWTLKRPQNGNKQNDLWPLNI